jgi:alkylation response protein AidB-like acyl-CoA dehydrogenase
MNFALSDEHRMLRDMARNFTSKEIDLAPLLVPGATVAAARYAETWQKMAELGWAGLVIPEALGGSGMSCIDLSMIIGETGRTLAPCPFLGTLAGTWAVLKGGSEQQKRDLLANVVTGKITLALAVCDAGGGSDGPASDAKATKAAGHYVLDGSKSFVVDAAAADVIVVAAEHAGKRGLFLVDAKQAGVQIALLPWRDLTRQVCDVSFDKARA